MESMLEKFLEFNWIKNRFAMRVSGVMVSFRLLWGKTLKVINLEGKIYFVSWSLVLVHDPLVLLPWDCGNPARQSWEFGTVKLSCGSQEGGRE